MNLGCFETLANNHFKTLDDERKVFFAQGPLGRRGYFVDTSELEETLRKTVKRFYRWLFIICVILFGGLAGPLTSKLNLLPLQSF